MPEYMFRVTVELLGPAYDEAGLAITISAEGSDRFPSVEWFAAFRQLGIAELADHLERLAEPEDEDEDA
jgi:hypothetical protein